MSTDTLLTINYSDGTPLSTIYIKGYFASPEILLPKLQDLLLKHDRFNYHITDNMEYRINWDWLVTPVIGELTQYDGVKLFNGYIEDGTLHQITITPMGGDDYRIYNNDVSLKKIIKVTGNCFNGLLSDYKIPSELDLKLAETEPNRNYLIRLIVDGSERVAIGSHTLDNDNRLWLGMAVSPTTDYLNDDSIDPVGLLEEKYFVGIKPLNKVFNK